MKKNLLLVFVFVFVSTFGFTQQVLKKVTQTSTSTIIELFTLANGTNNSSITGSNYFTSS